MGTTIVLFGLGIAKGDYEFYKSAIETTATISQNKVKDSNYDTYTQKDVYVRYTVRGKQYVL